MNRFLGTLVVIGGIMVLAMGCDNRKASADADSDDEDADVVEHRDPKAQAAATDKEIAEELAKPGSAAEARAWCAPSTNHMGFEMSTDDMLKIAEGAYAAGAVKVWVTGIDEIGGRQISASMAVELPKDAAARKKVFEWEAKLAPKIDQEPSKDVGQKYLDLSLD